MKSENKMVSIRIPISMIQTGHIKQKRQLEMM